MSRYRFLDGAVPIFLSIVVAMAILIPASNLLLPSGSALHVSDHLVLLLGKYFAFFPQRDELRRH